MLKDDLASAGSQDMNWQKWVGAAACVILIVSCFIHWAYYPDIQKHFTGFDSKVYLPSKGRIVNYYGRPGILLTFFATLCLTFHLIPKIWAKRANLLIAALCVAYAIKSYFMYSAAYTGYIPQKEAGLWIMLAATAINLIVAAIGKV